MSRIHLALLAVVALAAGGCLPRLTDPVFAFQELRAREPTVDGQTLVFGSVEFEPGFFGPHDVAEIVLKRVRPAEEEFIRVIATKDIPYRAFKPRQVKDGHFLGPLEPGAYELLWLVGDDWSSTRLVMDEDGRKATRFTVTRPGILDLGVLHVTRNTLGVTYSLTVLPPSSRPERMDVLRAAVKGTAWERYLDAEGKR